MVIIFEMPQIHSFAENKNQLYVSSFMQGGERIEFKRLISFEALQTAAWGGEMRQLNEDLEAYCKNGYRMILMAGSEKTLPIIKHDLEENGIYCKLAGESDEISKGQVLLTTGSLSGGFEYPENKTVLIRQRRRLHHHHPRCPLAQGIRTRCRARSRVYQRPRGSAHHKGSVQVLTLYML